MSVPESEKEFLEVTAGRVPGVAGYRGAVSRRETDLRIREHLVEELDALSTKAGEIRSAAGEEGDVDMAEDVARLLERLERTAAELRSAEYGSAPFFTREELSETELNQIHGHDLALLEDLDLLARDMESLKYETIGTLTLREVEGTLASIELRIANRKHLLESPGP